MSNAQIVDRQRGALLGLAVGDALGAPIELHRPGTFAPVTGFRGGGPHDLAAGEWTDDTSMALALAASIAEAGWDLNDQALRYVAWWRKGDYSVNGRCFSIGNRTRPALARFEQTGNARESGSTGEGASSNGSIMRIAPVPIRYLHLFPEEIADLSRLASESSLPTHASRPCLSACRYLCLALCGLMHGSSRDEVLDPSWQPLEILRRIEPLHPEVNAIAQGSFRTVHPPAIQGTGHVARSLEAALWAFHDANDFQEAVLGAVNLGDDADTTGAVCGQLAGAWWGESGIPENWRTELAHKEMIEDALSALLGADRDDA